MARAAGLFMILLGLVGITVSAIDWRSLDDRRTEGEDRSAQVDDATDGEDAAGAEGSASGNSAGVVDRVAAQADQIPRAQQAVEATGRIEALAEPADTSTGTKASTGGNPASVRTFERDRTEARAEPTLWADIVASSEAVDEGSGHADFLVTLSEPAEQSVIVIFSTVDLSAKKDEDYRSQQGMVTFEPGVVSAEIRTPLVDDDVKEDDEQFAIVLNGAPGIVNFRNRRITATIRDDD